MSALLRLFFLLDGLHFEHEFGFAIGITDRLLYFLFFVFKFEESVLDRSLLMLRHFKVSFGIHHLGGRSYSGHACHVEHGVSVVVQTLLVVN